MRPDVRFLLLVLLLIGACVGSARASSCSTGQMPWRVNLSTGYTGYTPSEACDAASAAYAAATAVGGVGTVAGSTCSWACAGGPGCNASWSITQVCEPDETPDPPATGASAPGWWKVKCTGACEVEVKDITSPAAVGITAPSILKVFAWGLGSVLSLFAIGWVTGIAIGLIRKL